MTSAPGGPYEIVVIGASLGGLTALKVILQGLRSTFPLPIAIAQHRASWSSAADSGALASILQRHSALPITEPDDQQPLVPGHVYVAPAAYHLLVERTHCSLTLDAPVQYARPSIDVLFESAAESFGAATIGVVLTAGSEDGVAGAVAIKRRGGLLVVQDPATAESRILPDAVLAVTEPDGVLSLPRIAPFLTLTCDITQQARLKRAS